MRFAKTRAAVRNGFPCVSFLEVSEIADVY